MKCFYLSLLNKKFGHPWSRRIHDDLQTYDVSCNGNALEHNVYIYILNKCLVIMISASTLVYILAASLLTWRGGGTTAGAYPSTQTYDIVESKTYHII